jgi:hypothetical protein
MFNVGQKVVCTTGWKSERYPHLDFGKVGQVYTVANIGSRGNLISLQELSNTPGEPNYYVNVDRFSAYQPKAVSHSTLVSEILATSKRVNDGRTAQDILTHAVTELGELALEVQISEGKSYKKAGKDGVVGEALDVISCMVDLIYVHYGRLASEEFMVSLMKPKLDKWKEKADEIANRSR